MIKIAIVDDEKLICEGLNIIFSSYSDIEVSALGSNGIEAFDICKKYNIDLILLDIRMPVCNGVEAVKNIHKSFPNIKIIILTTFNDSEYIQKAMNYGACGYLLKDSNPDVIYDGIKAAISGNIVIHPDVARSMLSSTGKQNIDYDMQSKNISEIQDEYGLSIKEIEIIKLVAEGFTNKEIAVKQFLSEGTIKNKISVIFTKTFVLDRTQLAAFAFRSGIAHL